MKTNATMLFHQMNLYFTIDYCHISKDNLGKAPIFYNDFFDLNEHIVLVDALHLDRCLQRARRAIIICLEPPEKVPEEAIGTNDLIILNDPMSDKMAFNILNHVLEYYQEFEAQLNEILYTHKSFQDLIEVLTNVLDLPLALSDENFRYIAYSQNSGKYIREYVASDNVLNAEAAALLQEKKDFRDLEKIQEAFTYQGSEPLVCKNIFHDGAYVGRLAVIIPDKETDVEYCKAIFNYAAVFIERLYDQYSSFSNPNSEYRKIHDNMSLIFRHEHADRSVFKTLMNRLGVHDTDDLRVIVLIPRGKNDSIYNSAFTCEHLERLFPGCFCVSLDGNIVLLVSETFYQNAAGGSFTENLKQEIAGKSWRAGVSRIFHTLDIFDIIYTAYNQAIYAIDQAETKPSPESADTKEPSDDLLYFFDDLALDYLLQHGAAGTTFEQNGHPALITLKEHDASFGSNYLETLRSYMDCNMNAVETARRLFIHRSSFIGRMERMNRLVNLNLDDPKERLYINLTFAVFLHD